MLAVMMMMMMMMMPESWRVLASRVFTGFVIVRGTWIGDELLLKALLCSMVICAIAG